MKRTLKTSLLFAGLAVCAAAQTPSVAGSDKDQQTIRGVLLDASCSAIITAKAPESKITAEVGSGTSVNIENAPPTAATATGPGTKGAYSSTGGAGAGNKTGTKATGTARNAPVSEDGTPNLPQATAGTASGPGTSGAYASTGTAGSTAAPLPSVADRAHTKATAMSGDPGSLTGEREKYRGCMVQADTMSFALHSDGKVVLLDEASNKMVRDRMSSGAFSASMTDKRGSSKWMEVTMTGKATADRFTVSSMTPHGKGTAR